MKNKVVLFILAVALFIPSFVAITSYTRSHNAPVNEKTATKMVLSDLNGTEYTFEKLNKDDESSRMIDFFTSMNERATQTTSLPDALAGSPFFRITMGTVSKESSYQYYFSTNPADSYFVSPDGTTYKINEEDAKQFITSKYAESMYKVSEFPSMLLSDQYSVKPKNAEWNYKNYSGAYTSSDLSSMLSEDVKEYRLEGGFDFSFSLEPDYILVKVVDTSDGSELFNDPYENLSTLSFSQSKIISVDITARWYEDDTRSYYGESYYSFKTTVSAPAEFYLSKSEIDPGEFIVISAKNVSSPDKIIFKSEPSIEYEPTFYAEGEYVHALIPIKIELTNSSYVFSVTYGGVSQNLTLNITGKTFRTLPYAVSQSIVNNYYTEAALTAYDNAFKEITSKTSSERLWKGAFLEPVKGNIITGFGHTRTIGSTGLSYRMTGVDYSASATSNIVATNDGVVVYKDILDFSGYTIVIDHGWGLKSWYSHLSSSDVMVGDTVTKGSVIGVAGNTGFTNMVGVYFGMRIGNIPVSPYQTWEDSEAKGIAVNDSIQLQ